MMMAMRATSRPLGALCRRASAHGIAVRALSAVTSGATSVYPAAPSPLQEFSVVYTDRALNHMSDPFKQVMLDISSTMKEAYNAAATIVIPGSGTYGMEAVARQFASGKKAVVLRNGYFSFRWTQIFEQGGIPSSHIVAKARCVSGDGSTARYAPMPIDELEALIAKEKPVSDARAHPHRR